MPESMKNEAVGVKNTSPSVSSVARNSPFTAHSRREFIKLAGALGGMSVCTLVSQREASAADHNYDIKFILNGAFVMPNEVGGEVYADASRIYEHRITSKIEERLLEWIRTIDPSVARIDYIMHQAKAQRTLDPNNFRVYEAIFIGSVAVTSDTYYTPSQIAKFGAGGTILGLGQVVTELTDRTFGKVGDYEHIDPNTDEHPAEPDDNRPEVRNFCRAWIHNHPELQTAHTGEPTC